MNTRGRHEIRIIQSKNFQIFTDNWPDCGLVDGVGGRLVFHVEISPGAGAICGSGW